VQDSY